MRDIAGVESDITVATVDEGRRPSPCGQEGEGAVLLYGHRGAKGEAPEHTAEDVVAFTYSGVEGLSTDVLTVAKRALGRVEPGQALRSRAVVGRALPRRA